MSPPLTGASRQRVALCWVRLGAVLGLALALGACSMVREGSGTMTAPTDSRWQVLADVHTTPPVLRLWDAPTDAGDKAARPLVENRVFLPASLAQPSSEWQILELHVHASRVVVVLQYRPAPQTENLQQKRFEFNLLAPQQPLVFYRASTTRGTLVDWQTVDFVARTALFCRNAPANQPDSCTPIPATLRAEPTPTLRTIGSAEDFTAPIDMPVRY
jgi:hypothetical protein